MTFYPLEEEDSTLVYMDPLEDKADLIINSFTNIPKEINGKSCYFSLTKNAYINQQFIFAGTITEGIITMQLNGNWIDFKGDSPVIMDSMILNAKNDSLILNIRAIKDSAASKINYYKGDIKILKESNNQFSSSVYGSCDC